MKSSTETFESSMCHVVRVSKRQARGLGDKCCCFQEDPSLPASPSQSPVPLGTVGEGLLELGMRIRDTERDHRTETFRDRETQRETGPERERRRKER